MEVGLGGVERRRGCKRQQFQGVRIGGVRGEESRSERTGESEKEEWEISITRQSKAESERRQQVGGAVARLRCFGVASREEPRGRMSHSVVAHGGGGGERGKREFHGRMRLETGRQCFGYALCRA